MYLLFNLWLISGKRAAQPLDRWWSPTSAAKDICSILMLSEAVHVLPTFGSPVYSLFKEAHLIAQETELGREGPLHNFAGTNELPATLKPLVLTPLTGSANAKVAPVRNVPRDNHSTDPPHTEYPNNRCYIFCRETSWKIKRRCNLEFLIGVAFTSDRSILSFLFAGGRPTLHPRRWLNSLFTCWKHRSEVLS